MLPMPSGGEEGRALPWNALCSGAPGRLSYRGTRCRTCPPSAEGGSWVRGAPRVSREGIRLSFKGGPPPVEAPWRHRAFNAYTRRLKNSRMTIREPVAASGERCEGHTATANHPGGPTRSTNSTAGGWALKGVDVDTASAKKHLGLRGRGGGGGANPVDQKHEKTGVPVRWFPFSTTKGTARGFYTAKRIADGALTDGSLWWEPQLTGLKTSGDGHRDSFYGCLCKGGVSIYINLTTTSSTTT